MSRFLRASFCGTLLLVGLSLGKAAPPTASAAPEASASPTPSPAPTPEIYSADTMQALDRLRDAALASDYAYRQVAHLSNNIGPRLSGSAQAQKAVEYVGTELKAVGCEVRTEKVMVPHWVRGEETAALTE